MLVTLSLSFYTYLKLYVSIHPKVALLLGESTLPPDLDQVIMIALVGVTITLMRWNHLFVGCTEITT